jgi:FkbM family methyltransferase
MLNTSQKILIARGLCSFIVGLRRLIGLPAYVTADRGGVKWSLDLKEGIDLAIYVLGGFEVRTIRCYQTLVHDGDVVLDIGANIGAHTLPLAKLVGSHGKVFAFEPTKYAFDKLMRNLALNATLARRVDARQIMLAASESGQLPTGIYSSWPLDRSADLHVDHRGQLMSTQGATVSTLDQYVRHAALDRVDFIKIDVDGNEHDVLFGGQETLSRFRPTLLMELAPYVYESSPDKFDHTLELLWNMGFEIADVANGKKLPHDPEKVRALIPPRGGINALATL